MNNSQNSFFFKNKETKQQFLQQFGNFILKKLQNYQFYFKKEDQIIINVHKKKLYLQGHQNNIETWLQNHQNIYLFVEKTIILPKKTFSTKIKIDDQKFYVGFDEVGLSDFFGPLVISSFIVNDESKKILKNLNICDSKKLSRHQIYDIGSQLITFKNFISYKIISPQKFNQLYKKKYHQKQLLAYFYGKMGQKWLQKYDNINLFFDQFVTKKSWKNYHKTLNIPFPDSIYLFPKGEEKYLGIAAASIIGRFLFLKEIEKIEKIFNTKIFLGASLKVQKQAKNFLHKNSKKTMKNYLKNFLSLLD